METMATRQLPIFERFIDDMRAVWASDPDTESRMRKSKVLLERLVIDPSLLSHSKAWPLTVGQNLLLYEDEDYDFVVNAVVRPPGYKGGIHDHAHAFVLYGIVDGIEQLERYDRLDDGSKPGYADIELSSVTTGTTGTVDLVPPFAIHAEQGGPGRSVALIVRSERLVGKVLQHGYDINARSVVQRSGPVQVPFELGRRI
jgi:predicted metal-dependent enzyme (double-stranded beta helix superfamily)